MLGRGLGHWAVGSRGYRGLRILGLSGVCSGWVFREKFLNWGFRPEDSGGVSGWRIGLRSLEPEALNEVYAWFKV